MLIGSQPLSDHAQAARLVRTYMPEIPNWVQLPVYKREGMLAQYAAGLPGLAHDGDRTFVDARSDHFDEEMLAFFEEYLAISEQPERIDQSRFSLTPEDAPGFYALRDHLTDQPDTLFAVKGQITGPITFCTGLTDQDRRAIFYDDGLRDAAVKMLSLKAAWQVRQLRKAGVPVIVFIDEPALAGYGSSELISISKEDIAAVLHEVIAAIHDQGAAAGVHVCANTDWSLLLTSAVDIINFDANGYFDKFVLYGDQIKQFITRGGCLAWGMVPTAQADQIEAATLDGLWAQWQDFSKQMAAIGIPADTLQRQSFITPSCGTGSLTPALGQKVLQLTQALSAKIREV